MAESLDLEKMNIDAEALNCMAQGKRHLLVHDFNSAVRSLEEACKLYDSKYGISADECADAYANYGHALLELHRQESGALDGFKASPADSDAENEEEEEEDEDVEEILDEESQDSKNVEKTDIATSNGNQSEAIEEDISESPAPVDHDQPTTSEKENGTLAAGSSANGSNGNASTTDDQKPKQTMETDDPNQPSTSTGITDDNRAEEDPPTNIEVAYEVLTMAQDIFQRRTGYCDDAFLKLSETKQKLGEIFLEWKNFPSALEKFNESLEIRKRHVPDDDRLIAESYYHIRLTHSLDNKQLEANNFFQRAVDVIEQRISRLKASYTSAPEENRPKIEDEIKDLESVLPEMKSRIEDTQSEMSTSKLASVVEEDEKLEEEKLAEKKAQIHAKPISNVSHLVKRKREEPTEQSDANQAKKLKNGNENGSIENGSNGTVNVEMKEE